MRAPLGPAAYAVLLLLCPTSLVLAQERGYHVEDAYHHDDAIDVEDIRSACPSDRLLRTRDTCHVDGADIQCMRLHCCDDYVFIAGRCIHKSVDPCSLQLCEQACEVRSGRVWCTCHHGFQYNSENYRRKTQPYCTDVNECTMNNGGCEQRCVNDPGGYHCECTPPMVLANDGKKCHQAIPIAVPKPLPLVRATSRCYAPCDTVTWLSKKVKQLSDQLHITQATLKKISEHPMFKNEGGDQFAEGTFTYRVLDSTAPLEGGYCRCERGPRGPPGAPGMEGPKGDVGPRGPRGTRGPNSSLDLMLLLIADLRHDIHNLEDRVYKDGEHPERFNLQKAWRRQRKQEKLQREANTEQTLEAYTAPPLEGPVQITPNGRTGEISHDSEPTTDWSLVKGETDPSDLPLGLSIDMDEKLRQLHLLANTTDPGEEDIDTDYDYSFF